jgi:hypothetical protein
MVVTNITTLQKLDIISSSFIYIFKSNFLKDPVLGKINIIFGEKHDFYAIP